MYKLHARPEHFTGPLPEVLLGLGETIERHFSPRAADPGYCFRLSGDPTGTQLKLSYFVGVDWLRVGEHALYVEPKLDGADGPRTDYLGMLLSALRHPDLFDATRDLFVIDFDATPVTIAQQQDLLTPLLAVQFLHVVRRLVRKGLKRSYYAVERTYAAVIKGKIQVAKTVKRHLVRHRQIDTVCTHQEFGFDGWENRLLKLALRFVQRYLPALGTLPVGGRITAIFHEVMPAFAQVSEEAAAHERQRAPVNVFYREYDEGIRLARLIMRRFGYNLNRAQPQEQVLTPPFWIDMSKLFELHVLGLLKNAHRHAVIYHAQGNYGEPDFLLRTEQAQMIIDAKYKRGYAHRHFYSIDDIRQMSGYGRDRKLLCRLGLPPGTVATCLIVYPAEHSTGCAATESIDLEQKAAMAEFEQFYKIPVTLPQIN